MGRPFGLLVMLLLLVVVVVVVMLELTFAFALALELSPLGLLVMLLLLAMALELMIALALELALELVFVLTPAVATELAVMESAPSVLYPSLGGAGKPSVVDIGRGNESASPLPNGTVVEFIIEDEDDSNDDLLRAVDGYHAGPDRISGLL